MPSDAFTYQFIAKELNNLLSGARIERVGMPSKEDVILSVRPKEGNKKSSLLLLLSVSSSRARVCITNENAENPLNSFSFLMHLRKHIGGGTITAVDTVKRERIYRFFISAFDELGYKKEYILYAEMMGRYSNLVLTGENGIITDCLKHISMDVSQKHAVLPGLTYSYPPAPENKVSPDDNDGVISLLKKFEGGKLADFVMGGVYGYSPLTMREIVFRAFNTLTPEADEVKNNAHKFLQEIKLADERYSPCVKYDEDKISDFFAFPYIHTDAQTRSVTSLVSAMQDFYAQTTENGYSSVKATQLINLVKTAIKKNEKSLAILSDRIMESKDYEEDRIKGELLTANIYKLRQGMDKITVDNYYTGSSETILLDPTLSPQKNAQKYYKAYNKKKTAVAKSEEQIAIAREKTDYYDSILASLTSADDDTTLAEIAIEMESAGIIKKAGAKKRRKPSSPHAFTVKGYKVLIGKNNVQNDNLVRQSEGGWLWLHTQKIHGSHGVIQGTNIPQEVINEVAAMVAHYSKASMSANVPVDYTLIKYVKKPSGSPPGKVIYTHQQTVNVTPKKPNA